MIIGRGAETDALRSALAAAEDGTGGVVFLTGEAGIGKSRLASELATAARAHGVTVLTGRAVPSDITSPYRPLTEALLQALRGRPFPADAGLAPWLPALRAMIPAVSLPGQPSTATTRPPCVARQCCNCCDVSPGPPGC